MVRNLGFTVVSFSSAASLFITEFHAILAAVKMTRDLRNHSIIIYGDSRGPLQVIRSLNSSHAVVKAVKNWIALMSARKKVTLRMLVSVGNVRADLKAKAAPMMLVSLSHKPI